MSRSHLQTVTYRTARRIVVATVGTTLLVLGAILVVTPGPAVPVLALALAVLAVEFAWAQRWLRRLRAAAGSVAGRARGSAPQAPPRE